VPSQMQTICILSLLVAWAFIYYRVKSRRTATVWLLAIGLLTVLLTVAAIIVGSSACIDWVKDGGRIYGFPLISFVSEDWPFLLVVLLLILFAFFLVVWAAQLAIFVWKGVMSLGQRRTGLPHT